jgi:hypothetical protein
MKLEEHNNTSFSLENYEQLLELAKKRFPIITFEEIADQDSFCIWRHDVDFSLDLALKLAQIDARHGVTSTFFVNIHSDTYNALSPTGRSSIKGIIEMGHLVGLHIDASWYGGIRDEQHLEQILGDEAKQIEIATGVVPSAFSFHNPTSEFSKFSNEKYGGLLNCYGTQFFQEIRYCSDSNGYWRFESIFDVLMNEKTKRVQVLTHAEWWSDLQGQPRERLIRALVSDAINHVVRYDSALDYFGRENQSEYKPSLDKLQDTSSQLFVISTLLSAYLHQTEQEPFSLKSPGLYEKS